MTVSVVLPTRDRAHSVGRAIESVLAQTHRAVELIVVDDGSRDETPDVLRRFGPQITVLTVGEGGGVYAARNLGLRHATGDLVAFIDSDDVWHADRLAAQLPLMQRHEVGLVFGDARHLGADGAIMARTCFEVTPPRRGRIPGHFAWGNFVPIVTVLVRRRCLDEVGGFPVSHDVSTDYLTWFRVALRHELDHVDKPIADYTVHDAGISNDLGHSLQARIELFSAELTRTTDPSTRAMVERIVFNLGLHLAVASARGRAVSVPRARSVAAGAIAVPRRRDAARLAGGFVVWHARARLRRRLPGPIA